MWLREGYGLSYRVAVFGTDENDNDRFRSRLMQWLVFFVFHHSPARGLSGARVEEPSNFDHDWLLPFPWLAIQVSRFLVNSLGEAEPPRGISRAHTLYTLAKQVLYDCSEIHSHKPTLNTAGSKILVRTHPDSASLVLSVEMVQRVPRGQ